MRTNMKNLGMTLLLVALSSAGGMAQTYTNSYSKEVTRLAEKWVKKGEWRNGFTKASPAPTVNLAEFYLQYQ